VGAVVELAELMALLGAGAGAASTAASQEAGKRAVGRVLEVFHRERPEQAAELKTVLTELVALAAIVGEMANANTELAEALAALGTEVKNVTGVHVEIAGDGKVATFNARVETVNM
jgi:flagellar motor component MotA